MGAQPAGRRPVDAALVYVERGWHVFPCHSIKARGGCTCGSPECTSPGKHPRTERGLYAATIDPTRVATWWRRCPNANVGIRTGAVSGLVVIDIDPLHGGLTSFERLVDEWGQFPLGRVVRTGSRGFHLFFRHPGGEIRNSVNRIGPGIDIRGDGGYVIAPPSIHVTGDRYVWASTGPDIPDVPEWMLHRIRAPELQRARPSDPIRIDESLHAWAHAALEREASEVAHAPVGARNHTLNRSAFSLGQIVGTGIMQREMVESVLTASAVAAGLSEKEAHATIASGLHAGERLPRGPQSRTTTRRVPARARVEREHDHGIEAEVTPPASRNT
jgi:hypothetical protein